MTKIFIDKKANVAEVVEEIINAEDTSVALVIPKQAEISESPENFMLLKREADAASKEIFIESVDEDALLHAEACGIETIHPLFEAKSDVRKSLVDIVPQSKQEGPMRSKKSAKGPKVNVVKSVKKISVSQESDKEEEIADRVSAIADRTTKEEKSFSYEELDEAMEHQESSDEEKKPKRSYRIIIRTAILIAVILAGAWGVGQAFGKATATLNFKKTAWQYDDTITASKSATKLDGKAKVLPAEVFTEERNLTQLFVASSKANVSTKAKGKLLVFNAYSSSPQALVANTRFVTPDGKMFRLDSGITVPGAGIKDGKITPASVETSVTADAPGISYNVGPVNKLVIPGFVGTPKYEGFYGQVLGKMEGGFVGEKAVPTDSDIQKAKERTTEILKTSLASATLRGRANEFEMPAGASDFTVTKLTVNPTTDEKGNFSIFGEARTRVVAFRKADIIAILEEQATGGNITLTLQSVKIEYINPKPDFVKGEMKIGVKASATRTARFSEGEFKNMIMGKRIADARSIIAGLPELSSANISLLPFWLGSVPSNPAKIKVSVE